MWSRRKYVTFLAAGALDGALPATAFSATLGAMLAPCKSEVGQAALNTRFEGLKISQNLELGDSLA